MLDFHFGSISFKRNTRVNVLVGAQESLPVNIFFFYFAKIYIENVRASQYLTAIEAAWVCDGTVYGWGDSYDN